MMVILEETGVHHALGVFDGAESYRKSVNHCELCEIII